MRYPSVSRKNYPNSYLIRFTGRFQVAEYAVRLQGWKNHNFYLCSIRIMKRICI
jgi:hypothetical protein